MENQNPEVKSQETEGRSPRPDRGGQEPEARSQKGQGIENLRFEIPEGLQREPAAAPKPKRKYRLTRKGRASRKALRARRANLAKARSAPKAIVYRPTAKRLVATEANLTKAIAARRKPKNVAKIRLNALKHGVFSRLMIEESVRLLGENEQEFRRHRQLFARLFVPRTGVEAWLVEEMADLSWRRLRLFHAQAQRETKQLKAILGNAPDPRPLDAAETESRAFIVLSVLDNESRVMEEVDRLRSQIEVILRDLLAHRSGGARKFKPRKGLDLSPIAEMIFPEEEEESGSGESRVASRE